MRAIFIIAVFAILRGAHSAKDPIEANPDKPTGPTVDPASVGLQNKYCHLEGKQCNSLALGSQYAATLTQCVGRCNNDLDCLHVDYSADKICTLRSARCALGQLTSASGAHTLYRLKVGETCPSNFPQYTKEKVKYSNFYCMAWGKKCVGHNLYPNPLKIGDYNGCLKKCSKIKTCASVDYSELSDGTPQCQPKEYHCSDEEIDDDDDINNFMRLPIGETTCPGDRVPPSPTRPPTLPPTEPPRPTTKPTVCKSRDECMCGTSATNIKVQVRIFGGLLFQVESTCGKYKITTAQIGAQYCAKFGAVLASPGQLRMGQRRGCSSCSCGWMGGGFAGFPSSSGGGGRPIGGGISIGGGGRPIGGGGFSIGGGGISIGGSRPIGVGGFSIGVGGRPIGGGISVGGGGRPIGGGISILGEFRENIISGVVTGGQGHGGRPGGHHGRGNGPFVLRGRGHGRRFKRHGHWGGRGGPGGGRGGHHGQGQGHGWGHGGHHGQGQGWGHHGGHHGGYGGHHGGHGGGISIGGVVPGPIGGGGHGHGGGGIIVIGGGGGGGGGHGGGNSGVGVSNCGTPGQVNYCSENGGGSGGATWTGWNAWCFKISR